MYTGSAAWLGPHLPSTPRPRTPVLPRMLRGRLVASTRYSPSWLARFTCTVRQSFLSTLSVRKKELCTAQHYDDGGDLGTNFCLSKNCS